MDWRKGDKVRVGGWGGDGRDFENGAKGVA